MKKQYILASFVFLLLFVSIISVNASFTKVHNFRTLKSIEESTDSTIMQLCGDRKDLILDGNMAADIFVIHYVDNQFLSYVFTHSKQSGYLNCLTYAGQDKELQCFCYGLGLHNVQDYWVHTDVGLVPKYLKSYAMSNLVGHMAIELDEEYKTDKIYKDDPIFTSGELDALDGRMLSNLFPQEGGDIKYIKLLSRLSGLSEEQVAIDANLIAKGYRGEGFYNTVDKYKTGLPLEFWFISMGLILLGIFMPIIFLFLIPRIFGLQTTWWKYILLGLYGILLIVGLILVSSYFFHNTWELVRDALRIIPIRVSDADVKYYTTQAIADSAQFLRTGILPYDDVSGLTYRDSITGALHKGALSKAEFNFHWILMPILVLILVGINVFLLFKMYRKGNKK